MCGILGFVSKNDSCNKETFGEALDMLRHRGPDDAGEHHQVTPDGSRLAMGHRRLSILDLTELGHQPMISPRTGTIIVYNGEVYNFAEIRTELISLGYAFESNCDTEVILAAYDQWGDDCVLRFNGMFAFAIYDPKLERIFLARDRVGIKPLYYYHEDSLLAFSSELTALLKLGVSPVSVRPESLADFFGYGYFPGEMTPLHNHHKLGPGHSMAFDLKSGRISIKRYWNPTPIFAEDELVADQEELTDRLEDLLLDSVEKRMISDVPLGAFLSGGIDSSLVVALMNKIAPKRVKTFTIGFSVPEMDEAPFAKKIAEHLGTEHHELYVTPKNLEEIMPQVAAMYDEPFADTSCVPTAVLSKMTRDHVTVALSGDGGDELFFGYMRYQRAAQFMRFRKLPSFVRAGIRGLLNLGPTARIRRWSTVLAASSIGEFYAQQCSYRDSQLVPHPPAGLEWEIMAREVQKAFDDDAWRRVPPAVDFSSYLPDDLLVKVDRASMAVALEARVPLLDHRFVELAARTPHAMKFCNNTTKFPLRTILAKYVPREFWERPKSGFAIPLGQWFRKELKSWMLDELTGNWDWTLGIIDKVRAKRFIRDHLAGRFDYSRFIWSFLAVKTWSRRIGLVR